MNRFERARHPLLARFLAILLALLGTVSAPSFARDVILDGATAVAWLRSNHYIDSRNVPQSNFYTFRSQVLGGGAGPRGLKAIMANGWSFSGPMTDPISQPVVIVVDDRFVGSSAPPPVASPTAKAPLTVPGTPLSVPQGPGYGYKIECFNHFYTGRGARPDNFAEVLRILNCQYKLRILIYRDGKEVGRTETYDVRTGKSSR